MKRISALILGLLLSGVFTLPAWPGTLTTNKFLYKPGPGARGDTEKNTFDAGLDRIDARLGKETWVGDPNYGTTLQDAVTAIGAVNKTILRVPAGAWAITSDLSIPATITLKLERGAILNLATATTLTINGDLNAGPHQIFSWTGTGKVKFARTSPQVNLYPEWWGAVGDSAFVAGGGTDNLAAFQAAVACAFNSGKGNIVLSGMYRLSDTLSLNNFQAWPTDQRITVTGHGMKKTGFYSEANAYPAVEVIGSWNVQLSHFAIVGSGTAGKIPSVGLMTSRSTTSSTNSDNHFNHLAIYGTYLYGQIYDMNGSDNRYDHLETYTTAAAATAASTMVDADSNVGQKVLNVTATTGFAANDIVLINETGARHEAHVIDSVQPDVSLTLKTNLIYSHTAGQADTVEKLGWRFGVALTGGTTVPDPFGIPDRTGILKVSGAQSSDNVSFSNSSFMATGGVPTNSAAYYIKGVAKTFFNNIYTGPLADADSDIYRISASGNLTFINCPFEANHRYTFNISSPAAGSSVTNIFTQGVSNSGTSTLALLTDANSELKNCTFDLRSLVAGNVSIGGGASNCEFRLAQTATSFVQAAGVYSFYGNEITFGSSMTNFDINPSGYARNNIINDQRGFSGGPVTGRQRVIDGDVQVGQPSFVTPNVLTLNTYKTTWAAAAPTSGSWTRGSVIWNTGATSGGSPGWVCVLDTTFGTLNAGGTTGDMTTGTNLLTVNSVTGMTIGNHIDITGVSGPKRITNIDSANKTVTLDSNANATVTGAAISFHNHTSADAFKAMANLQ